MDRAYETSRKRPVKTQYLILYNFISAILWLAVFGRVILLLPILGHRNVYGGVGEFAKWTQTVAVLEVLHSASGIIKLIAWSLYFSVFPNLIQWKMRREIDLFRWWIEGVRPVGIVRSPISTTLMQVSSRLLLVWGVVDNYPTTTSPSPFYSSMLLAWSITEIIRYSYFMLNLIGSVPGYLTWLRYNTFYVLYPVGITSEMLLIFYASNTTSIADNLWQRWAFRAILLGYVPGSFYSFQPRHRQKKKHPFG